MEEVSQIQRIPAVYIERQVVQTKAFRPIFEDGVIEFDSKNCIFKYRDSDGSKLHTTVGITIDEGADKMRGAIKAYEASSKEEYYVRWDPEGTGSFDIKKAFQDIKESTDLYLSKGAKDGVKAKVRGCLRKFSENADRFTLWLNFLPSDTYGSLIVGGVSVILKAASRMGHARDSVLEALDQLPEILASAGILDTMYKESPRLTNAVSTLYVATLLALELMLSWFHESPTRKFFEARKYDERLAESIGRVKECAEAVQKEAGLCNREINIATNKTVEAIRLEQANAFYHSNVDIKEHIDGVLSGQVTALRTAILNDLLDILANSPMLRLVRQQSQLQIEIEEEPEELPHSKRPPPTRKLPTGLTRSGQKPETVQKDMTRREFLTLVGSPFTETGNTDIRKCLNVELTIPEQDRVQAIVQSRQLKSFLSSTDSATLLVEGNTDSHDIKSSTSYVSATLIHSLRELKLPVIYFFCGLHQNSEPAIFNGPDGMMQSLFRQLLLINPTDLLSKALSLQKRPLSIKNIRKSTRSLLRNKQHPSSVTFCIIDGISFFEISKWEKRLKTVLASLMKAVNEPKGGGAVKVLITTPGVSRCVPKMVGREHVLSMRKDVVEGRGKGLIHEVVRREMRMSVSKNGKKGIA